MQNLSRNGARALSHPAKCLQTPSSFIPLTARISKATRNRLYPANQISTVAKRSPSYAHSFHSTACVNAQNTPPQSTDRGPVSKEDTQTDFGNLNVLGNIPPPATAIDMTTPDGFVLNNGARVSGGDGMLLVAGEAFTWRPWEGQTHSLVDKKGVWDIGRESLGLLELVWPKPGAFSPFTRTLLKELRFLQMLIISV
jgi:hypothetical protein